jgi:hypothetical protein
MAIPGVDYTEVFPPVASNTTKRVLVEGFLFCQKHCPNEKWKLEMFDLEVAFLNVASVMKNVLKKCSNLDSFHKRKRNKIVFS